MLTLLNAALNEKSELLKVYVNLGLSVLACFHSNMNLCTHVSIFEWVTFQMTRRDEKAKFLLLLINITHYLLQKRTGENRDNSLFNVLLAEQQIEPVERRTCCGLTFLHSICSLCLALST